jgi:hypothetical protein
MRLKDSNLPEAGFFYLSLDDLPVPIILIGKGSKSN